MKTHWSTAAYLGVLLAISGCDRAPKESVEVPPKTAITFLHYFTDSLSGGLDEMARTFNAQSPRYELKAVSLDHEAFKTSIQDTLKSGNPPDLYSYWAGARTAAIVADLEPVDDIWRQAKLDERFAPSLVRAASEYQGKKYFIPLTQHYVAFFYNKKIFDRLQLKPPANWAEFLAACAKIKAQGIIPVALGAKDKWPAQFWFDLLLLRTAPYEFRQKLMTGEVRYDDPRVEAVFRRWSDLIAKGYFNTTPAPNDLAWDSGASELVYNGLAAMTLMGTWEIGYFENENHRWQAGQDYDFFPFPIINPALPVVALGPIDGLVIPKKAPNREGAKEAITYLADIDAQQAISRGSGALAPNIRVPRTFYSDIQRRVLTEISNSPHFAFNYDLATTPAVAQLGLNAFSEFLAFPDVHPEILERLASEAAKHFQAPKKQP
jgi:ABC-type glycerol-3-phosphate transport system substrate-binding protein